MSVGCDAGGGIFRWDSGWVIKWIHVVIPVFNAKKNIDITTVILDFVFLVTYRSHLYR